MKRGVLLIMSVLGASLSVARADVTLVYGLKDGSSEAVEKQLYLSRFFARVDSSDEDGAYLLFQAGKFFPLYRVSEKERSYTLVTERARPTLQAGEQKPEDAGPSATEGAEQGAAAPLQSATVPEAVPEHRMDTESTEQAGMEPAEAQAAAGASESMPVAAPPETAEHARTPGGPPKLPEKAQFKPSGKNDVVGGVHCRIVNELIDGEPAIEHCMANKADLGITEREIRTLARLFILARELGYDWLGAATEDEDFVSVRSRALTRDKTLELRSASTDPLPVGHLRVPKDYKETELQRAPEPVPAAANQ